MLLTQEKNIEILIAVAQIYSAHGNDENQQFFTSLSRKISGWGNVSFANLYTDFLKRCSDDTITVGVKILEQIARNEDNKWVRHFGQKGIQDLANMYSDRAKKISELITNLKGNTKSSADLKSLEQQLANAKNQEQKLMALSEALKLIN